MTAAISVALISAFFFALAATLQQREAGLQTALGASDPRLLWRLAHRPWWLAGIVADIVSAGLHILALSLGGIAVVQPVGVTGLLFAIPMVALLRRTAVRARDLVAALVVLSGLALFLALVPHAQRSGAAAVSIVGVVAGTLAVVGILLGIVHRSPGRVRAVLLAAGAGIAFGVVAVLARALLILIGAAHAAPIVAAAVGIVLLIGAGYLLLQHAYRAGHFAASLATAVVIDPPAAIIAGAVVLHEPLPHGAGRLVLVLTAMAVVVVGIVVLVRSPAHVLALPDPEAASPDARPEPAQPEGRTML